MAKFEYFKQEAMPGKGPGIVLTDISEECFDEIRSFVGNQWLNSEAYKLKEGVNPFLQEMNKAGSGCWLFIEFWSDDEAAMNKYAEAIHGIFERHHI